MEVIDNKLFCLAYGNSQIRIYDLETKDGAQIDVIETAPC